MEDQIHVCSSYFAFYFQHIQKGIFTVYLKFTVSKYGFAKFCSDDFSLRYEICFGRSVEEKRIDSFEFIQNYTI